MPIHLQTNKPIYINIILYFYCIILSYLYSLIPYYCFILPLQSCPLTTYKGLIINILAIISLWHTFYIYILFHR